MTLHKVVTHKLVAGALLLICTAAAVMGGAAEWLYQMTLDTPLRRIIPTVAGDVAGLAWAGIGGVLAWLRPRNALGWIMLGVGTLTQVSLAEESFANAGGYGLLATADPWQGRDGGLALSAATGLAIYLLVGLLPVLYPAGRWPGRRWLLPTAAVTTGAVLLQLQWSLAMLPPAGPGSEAPVPVASAMEVPVAWFDLVPGTIYALGVLAVWAMSVVRLAQARHPERSQLLWLLVTVVALLAKQSWGGRIPGLWLQVLCLYLLPGAIAVGILRYRLLGIEAVLRRGLVYGLLTVCIVDGYAAVLAAAGLHLTGEPLVAVIAAALVAVGRSPLRNGLQRGVDLLLYGRQADRLAAVSELGALAAGAADHEILHVVLAGVQDAVRAPHARILRPDGGILASVGGQHVGGTNAAVKAAGTAGQAAAVFAARLTIGSVVVGTLEVAGRTPVERYPTRDERTLRAMAAQLAAVVHALALTTQLQEQRVAVLAATGRERERLRRDLHDGLGPSLTGVGRACRRWTTPWVSPPPRTGWRVA